MRVGINGLGRLGRTLLRCLWEQDAHVCAHINDINHDIENIAYLIQYDSVYGKFKGQVKVAAPHQIILQTTDRRWEILVSFHPTIEDVNWHTSEVECVIDSSGVEKNALAARQVVNDEVRHVIITHTFTKADFTLVFGVNEKLFDPSRHRVISSSICDAIAIAPVLKTIQEEFSLEQCFVTTLHPWLSYQNIMDGPVRSQSDPPSAYEYYPLGRASVGALIPKPTTVGPVLEYLIPALKNRVFSLSYRVPTSVVCSADTSLVTSRPVTSERLKTLLAYTNERFIRCTDELLVSGDYQGETVSSIVDLRWLEVRHERYIKLVLWYDNEWGYSSRVVDIVNRLRT